MRRFLTLLIIIATTLGAGTVAQAQTVIDLKRGGGVRAKDLHDYDRQNRDSRQLQEDSLEYVDCLKRAFNFLHTDSLSQAQRLFERALKLRPTAPGNYIVRHNLGRIFVARRQYRDAQEMFTQVLRERPDAVEARYDRAACCMESGQAQAAIDDCKVLSEAAQADTALRRRVLFLQAAAHTQLRQDSEALADLEEILRLVPGDESATLLYAITLADMGRPQEGMERLSRFIDLHPNHVEALTARADIEAQAGLNDLAREDYDAAIKLEPDAPQLYASRAAVLMRMGLKQLARKDMERAVALGLPRTTLNEIVNKP